MSTATTPASQTSRHFLCTDKRWYTIDLEPGQAPGWIIMRRRWGGLHNKRQGHKTDFFAQADAAQKHLQAILKRRIRHGYTAMPVAQEDSRIETAATTAVEIRCAAEDLPASKLVTMEEVNKIVSRMSKGNAVQRDLFEDLLARPD